MTPAPHEIALPGAAADLAARMAGLIPEIETARLRLRAPQLTDFPALLDIVNSPRGAGVGGPMSRDDTWFEFAQMTATWLWRGHGYWTVSDRTSGTVLGFVGIGFEPGDREPELGFMVSAAAEGKGIAYEAARAARDHGFGPLGLGSMFSYVLRANTRSVALAERLGARLDTPADWDDPDTLVYRHPAPEALQ